MQVKMSETKEIFSLGKFLFKFLLMLVLVFFLIGAVVWVLSFASSAGKVVSDEFSPEAMLKKYQWFLDQSNGIEKMDKDIVLYEQRRADVEKRYAVYGSDPSKWSVAIQVQYNHDAKIAKDDLVAIVSQRNNLVKEYNAQSEKFNWALFKDRPDLPSRSYFNYTVK